MPERANGKIELAVQAPAAVDRRAAVYTRDFFLVWLANFGEFAAFHFWTPVLPLYIVQAGGQATDVGLVIAVMSVSSLPVRLVGGAVMDRRGKRPLLWAGALVFLIGVAAHAWVPTVPLIAGARLVMGAGFAAFTGAAMALVADLVPPARRGEGIAVYSVSANVSQAIAPALAVALFGLAGFLPVMLLATAAALTALVTALLVRKPPGEAEVLERRRLAGSLGARWLAPGNVVVREALLPGLPLVFLFGGLGAQIAYVPLYAERLRLPNAGLFFTCFAVAVLLSRFATGRLSDRWGRQAMILPGIGAVILSLTLLATGPSAGPFFAASALFGLGFGAAQPALVAFAVDRAPAERRGAATGTFQVAADLGLVAVLPALGQLVSLTGYPGVFAGAAALLAVALALYTLGVARGH